MLVALPIPVAHLFSQRHFIRGMLAGAIKEQAAEAPSPPDAE